MGLLYMQSIILKNIQRYGSLKIVLVRHGQSHSNSIKKWSGWFDAKLTLKGQQQAEQCGMILKQHQLHFDIAYCSRLTRTIKTLNVILDQLDAHYLPVRKCWQLNQKFYGALQEINKIDLVHKYGEQTVSQWRRSYHIAPPKVFSQDLRHPRNDKRYNDIDPALLPCTQHLGDVLSRVKSIYESQIIGELRSGKKLLIVCHGSSLRAWTNILLGFDMGQSSKFHVPNATPLLIELNSALKGVRWEFLGDKASIQRSMQSLENQLKVKEK